MTDNSEQLELAAKAIGLEGEWVLDTNYVQERYYFNVPYTSNNMITGFEWNPRNNNNQALELAANLRIGFTINDDSNTVCAWSKRVAGVFCAPGTDIIAVRLAIFLAAVEIGRAL